ncbi:hypothetical protein CHUAL_002624 [Chamberlinius hualienensis]
MSEESGSVRGEADESGSTEQKQKQKQLEQSSFIAETNESIDDRVKSPSDEPMMTMMMANENGKSWVNNSNVYAEQTTNGEDEVPINYVMNGNSIKNNDSTVKDKVEIDLSDVNGDNSHSKEVLDDDEVEIEEKLNVKMKLNCTRGGKLLSHWEIMNKCLNKKTLFESLKVSTAPTLLYKCPICHFSKSMPQHVLFHMRSHKDLTSVFEFYQNFDQHPNKWADLPGENKSGTSLPPVDFNKDFEVNEDSDKSYLVDSEPDDNSDGSNLDVSNSKRKQQRRRRRRRKRRTGLFNNSPRSRSGATSEYLTSDADNDDESNVKLNLLGKSMTDVEDTYDDGLKMRRKLRKRKASTPTFYGNDFVLDPYESHLSMDEIFDELDYEFPLNVTPENPHLCQYCGTTFTEDNGIARHYAKHHRKIASSSQSMKKRKKKKKRSGKLESKVTGTNGTASATCQTTLSYSVNSFKVLPLDQVGLTKALTQLETNVNKILEYFVHDNQVLISIGWPRRNVNELVIDILERCSVAPVICGSTKLSKLQCLRQNVNQLLNFCIKDEVMEKNGWRTQIVDQVIIELIEEAEKNHLFEKKSFD